MEHLVRIADHPEDEQFLNVLRNLPGLDEKLANFMDSQDWEELSEELVARAAVICGHFFPSG
jgi:hypothetical protein